MPPAAAAALSAVGSRHAGGGVDGTADLASAASTAATAAEVYEADDVWAGDGGG